MTDLIDANTIAELTTIDESAMNDTCTLTGVITTDDGGGGSSETTTTTTVPCYFVAGSGDELDGDRAAQVGRHTFYLPKTTNVVGVDRITYKGVVYRVVFTPPITGYSTSRIVGVNER